MYQSSFSFGLASAEVAEAIVEVVDLFVGLSLVVLASSLATAARLAESSLPLCSRPVCSRPKCHSIWNRIKVNCV